MGWRSDSPAANALMKQNVNAIQLLAKTKGEPELIVPPTKFALGTTVTVVSTVHGPIEVGIGLKGLVEKDAELSRIDRELKKVDQELASIDKQLSSAGFIGRAPPEVVAEKKARRETLIEARKRLEEARVLAAEL